MPTTHAYCDQTAARSSSGLVPNENRQWPPPSRPWLLFMRWLDLAFLHWAVEPDQLQRRLPRGLSLDTFDGKAWVGITPFRMSDVRPRFAPPLPWVSAFPELNVRTYVLRDGKPGIWFLSLEAGNPLAVRGARWGYHLPYYDARMSVEQNGDWIDYRSRRTDRSTSPADFAGRYRPTGDVYRAVAGSLDYWLTERYCLYTLDRRGRLCRGEIHHAPWPLQPAEAEIEINTIAAANGVRLPPEPPLVHFARRQDVVGWYLDRLE